MTRDDELPEDAVALLDRLGIERARLRIYPDTGHALHWERPARFARDVEEFRLAS